MRCTRCNRPAVPQAVGVTPAGVFVFGWCVVCLEESGCQQIAIARPARHPSTRLALERSIPWAARPAGPPDPLGNRRRVAVSVALGLTVWGLVLLAAGLVFWALGLARATQLPSNGVPGMNVGGPVLLIGGGGSTAAVGFLLWALNARLNPRQSARALRVTQALSFLSALAILLAGIVYRAPRRDGLVVGVASAALVVSAAARWIEVRRSRALGAPDRGGFEVGSASEP